MIFHISRSSHEVTQQAHRAMQDSPSSPVSSLKPLNLWTL